MIGMKGKVLPYVAALITAALIASLSVALPAGIRVVREIANVWIGTIYIRADGSVYPPDAPIKTHDNVTYTLTGDIMSYADGIVVERDNIILDGAGHTIQRKSNVTVSRSDPAPPPPLIYKGINIQGRSNVTIKNTVIIGFDYGIYLDHSFNNVIIRNDVTSNQIGIYLTGSSNYNIISENNIANNDLGIRLWGHSNHNRISRNNVTNNSGGILLSSSNNIISENNIVNNGCGISLNHSFNNTITGNVFVNNSLVVLPPTYGNVVKSNTVNGKPLVYLEGVSGWVISDAGQVILVKCKRITIKGLNLSNTHVGIQLLETSDTRVISNNIANNYFGIWLWYSSNNVISENNIMNNTDGILLSHSLSNIISGNNITGNTLDGIMLAYSSNNTVRGNNIANNKHGIWLAHSSNNVIYHNNFVNNSQHVRIDCYDVCPPTNVWDDGYPSGGNYWSDYTGVDSYSGPYQNETGSDGIGDTPYVIDENNIDRYPLMNPWTQESEMATPPSWIETRLRYFAVVVIAIIVVTVAILRRKRRGV